MINLLSEQLYLHNGGAHAVPHNVTSLSKNPQSGVNAIKQKKTKVI